MQKQDFLKEKVRHIDVTEFDARPLIRAYGDMAFQARNLATATDYVNRMMADRECGVILTLAGSLFSAGLKDAVALMIENVVDQDFFEALGFRHYQGSPQVDDNQLRELGIDRIYDTYIDEDELRICDMTIAQIADSLPPRAYSSREFIREMGRYLDKEGVKADRSIIYEAYRKDVPIFCPAFSDCSAGFGLVHHQWNRDEYLTIDSVADFKELTQVKMELGETGILMIGGGVPKNFTQDVVVATEILGQDQPMHKYAVQITVADERDGALSGSTLQEACSWGKVEMTWEQMVFAEATLALPLLISDVFHRGEWRVRKGRALNRIFKEKARV